jgi:hypothetical protein
VVIREIDPGAETATQWARTAVLLSVGLILLIGVVIVVVMIRSRRRAKTT